MQLLWLGRYRNLVEKIIKFSNAYSSIYQKERDYGSTVQFSPAQLQVLEYILETEDQNAKMSENAERLGVSRSAFSKSVKKMVEKGLLERYHAKGNKKDIIIKPSALGREVYRTYCATVQARAFSAMFEVMDSVPQESLDLVSRALEIWADSLLPKESPKTKDLVKIDE